MQNDSVFSELVEGMETLQRRQDRLSRADPGGENHKSHGLLQGQQNGAKVFFGNQPEVIEIVYPKRELAQSYLLVALSSEFFVP